MKRIILEMGMGNDLYGESANGVRAVDDAIRHSSLFCFVHLVLTMLICRSRSQSVCNVWTVLIR